MHSCTSTHYIVTVPLKKTWLLIRELYTDFNIYLITCSALVLSHALYNYAVLYFSSFYHFLLTTPNIFTVINEESI